MLISLAIDYYYLTTSITTIITFDKVYDLIQIYFQCIKYKKIEQSR